MGYHAYLRRICIAATIVVAGACGSEPSTAPEPRASLTISADAGDVYHGDVLTFGAIVRDATGRPVADAPVVWTSSDNTIVEVSASGLATTLKPGSVRITARSGELTAAHDIVVRPLSVKSVTVRGLPDTLRWGDVVPFDVEVIGEGGRTVHRRAVTLATGNAAIAVIDSSGRVRAVTAGATTVVATVDGVSAAQPVIVMAEPAQLALRTLDGATLPVLIGRDTVEWDGQKELAEMYLESGSLQLTGGAAPKYTTQLRYAQYAVITEPGGQRRLQPRLVTYDRDRGLVSYDARGDLVLSSEVVPPLARFASPETDGMAMRYRIAGDDSVLSLFFRRESR